jgi:CheY-like chemotaxis protein
VILLVEDDPLVRINAEQQLRGLGYQVVAAENGVEALAVIERGLTPDLLFTDIVMPGGLTGIDLAQRLRARMPALRVLFTSGYTHGATANDGGALAHEHFLGKPFRSRDLARKVRESLDHQAT